VSDIDTVVVNSLKALDPEWPIREADLTADIGGRLKCARSRLIHRAKYGAYSITSFTSSARARSVEGTSSPSALAVLN
jgi:hypothetical protein